MALTLLSGATFQQLKSELSRMLSNGVNDPDVFLMSQEALQYDPDPVMAIYKFVRSNFAYAYDPVGMELFTAPKRMAQSYFAGDPFAEDCDGHALLVAAMLGSLGYQTRIILIDTSFDGLPDHAVAQVFSDVLGEWINVDTTEKFPPGWTLNFAKQDIVYPNGVW